MTDEASNHYVSSRGILKSCDYVSTTPRSSIRRLINYPDVKELQNHACPTIYVCGSAIPHFIQTLMPAFTGPFVLVSGDCDETIYRDIFRTTEEFTAFIDNPRLIRWFSQNAISKHEKLTQIPIGLDYHTMVTRPLWGNNTISSKAQESRLVEIATSAKPFSERFVSCHANFQFTLGTKYGYDRVDAIKSIPKQVVKYEPRSVAREETWQTQTKYAFVISPHGGGYDCHRTWEALILGCIPVVKTSGLDGLYDDLHVLIVNDWGDVTDELLRETVDRFSRTNFSNEKLTLSYWMDMIHSFAALK